MIKVFDAKSNEKKELNDKNVTMYVCGPTVYNDPHIGNMRPLLTFDVLYRLMQAQGYNVHYVHNLTDIDDKIIQRAKDMHISEMDVAKKYGQEYFKLMEGFNVHIPEIHKVSEEMPDMIKFIQKLVDNQYAYVVDGDVYFDVRKVKNYGELSHNKIDDLITGVRIENEPNKRCPADFALWKKTDEGLNWDSPWSKGRPGWHTECVVMCNKYLGNQITIHGGGIDLKFPHHENENAQNYGVNNCSLAKNFQYCGHLTVNGQKMSKSLGNVVLAKDALAKYSPNELKWFFYQKSYASPIDYSDEIMKDVKNQYDKLVNGINSFKSRYYLLKHYLPNGDPLYEQTFLDALNDDLNFANALTIIQSYLKTLSNVVTEKNADNLDVIYRYLLGALQILGINLQNKHTKDILAKLDEWNKLVSNKDYQAADAMRAQLMNDKIL